MKSGGEIRFNPQAAVERNNDGNRVLDEAELRAGLVDLTTGSKITATQIINPDTIVNWNGIRMTWAELKAFLGVGSRQLGEGRSVAQANIDPKEFTNQRLTGNLSTSPGLANEIDQMRAALSRGELKFNNTIYKNREAFEAAINQKVQALAKLIAQIRADNTALSKKADEGITEAVRSSAGVSSSDAGGNGTGQFSARSMAMPGGGQPGPAGGGPGAQGAKGMGFGGPGYGGGYGGYGDPLFSGMEPPSSAAYGAALYMDSSISDGLGQLLGARREGQKLMMLFLYFARMAESGDPFAMYNFIKFITYVISKDKARQNIHIGSKLIQLQDLSRKATETLMSADTTDPNKTQEFTKAMHQARSQEATISTSQKLLADMLQEYAHVTEGLINSTRSLQDFWGRATRRVTGPA